MLSKEGFPAVFCVAQLFALDPLEYSKVVSGAH